MKPVRVEAILEAVRGPSVLDIGCGGQLDRRSALDSPWWLHARLTQVFPDAVGLEGDLENVASLKEAGFPNVVHADAQDFQLSRKFDSIVAGELIEHLERPGSFFECAQRHLKDQGRLIVSTPYAFSLIFVIYAWMKFPKTCSNTEHTLWFCPATLTEMAARSGFVVEGISLVQDYRRDLSSSIYRALYRPFALLRKMLPSRVSANTMVVVLRLSE